MDTATWTPKTVEDLLFRQYIQEEDVTRQLPPPPKVSNENFLEKYDQATRILFSYVRNGPVSALASQNVNTAAGKYGGATPMKAFVGRTPATKPVPPEPSKAFSRTATPTPTPPTPPPQPSQPTSTASAAPPKGTMESPQAYRVKRQRVEWPLNVPTNQMLKSNSRSKVAHLTAKRVAAQQGVDPDLIFMQNSGDLPLHTIFAPFPKALRSVAAVRNASGDWRADAFTVEEEDAYKSDLGYTTFGPSQCGYGKWLPSQP
ncbi:chromosomal passenger protein putative (CPC1) [Leptomonas pyrrhocoris]|uniref:Chromosomal passenger protein putative (CPC1) n=1 Tax=Leptomonas pyrrhocoris TaxID=157538 RepID=A0A0M9G6U2_LEPPY|nr:chromosomal passenger protein putative (CPC1) [Leptomonas pyrrhocoris]KPA83496.1 chromosomal passenger protein putative (CPC1) [Leptomonas pyrrhocoris]|eukprot:XP_015661935.1 chromosomal passenger protein putative (CPC1) [Leptomonas pyrrhocoris]